MIKFILFLNAAKKISKITKQFHIFKIGESNE